MPQSQTGTSFTSLAPIARETVGGTEWGKGRLREGAEEWTLGPSLSSQERGQLHATSHAQQLTVAGNADRETLSLPEEGHNNGADTSGATHRADGSIYTRDVSHPYFEPALATESLFHTSHPTKTETDSSERLLETQTQLKLGKTGVSETTMVTDIHKRRDRRMFDSSATQEYRTVPSSLIPNLSSYLPGIPSWGTREGGTIVGPQGGAVSSTPEEALQHSRRGQRSTVRLNSELTSAITHNPSPSPTEQWRGGTSRAATGTESTASSSSFPKGPSTLFSSTAAPTRAPHHMENTSLTPRPTQSESLPLLATDATVQSNDTEAPDGSEDAPALRTLTFSAPTRTDSPERTESTTHFTTWSTSSTVTHAAKAETETAAPSTQSKSVNTYVSTQTVYSTSDGSGIVERTTTSLSPTTDAGPVLSIQSSATTESPSGTKTETPFSTYTSLNKLLTTNSPTSSPRLSLSITIPSSTPSHTAQTHSPPPASPIFTHASSPSPLPSTQSPGHVTTVGHKTPPVTSETAAFLSASSHTLQTQSSPPLPPSGHFPTTHKKAHSATIPDLPPVLPVTTAISEHGRQDVVVTKEHEPRQGSASGTTVRPAQRPAPRSTLQPSEQSRTTPTTSVLTSTWSSTSRPKPKFYIVPDQPADIKGTAACN